MGREGHLLTPSCTKRGTGRGRNEIPGGYGERGTPVNAKLYQKRYWQGQKWNPRRLWGERDTCQRQVVSKEVLGGAEMKSQEVGERGRLVWHSTSIMVSCYGCNVCLIIEGLIIAPPTAEGHLRAFGLQRKVTVCCYFSQADVLVGLKVLFKEISSDIIFNFLKEINIFYKL